MTLVDPGSERKAKQARNMSTVCVIGGGARALALLRALKASPKCCAVRCFATEPVVGWDSAEVGDAASPDAVLAFCRGGGADLIVVTDPAAIVAGVVDALQAAGMSVVGARQAAAAVAGTDCARALMKQFEMHACIPEDGAATGPGQEFTMMAFCDGATCVPMPPMQSFPHAFVDNTGPATQGMGCYAGGGDRDTNQSRLPFLSTADVTRAGHVLEHMMKALGTSTGAPYKGVLQACFRADVAGVTCTSFAPGAGEMEYVAAVTLLRSDLLSVYESVASGALSSELVEFDASVACVVKALAPFGFPDKPLVGISICAMCKCVDV